MPLSLLNHSALALFAQRTRIPTSARSIGFCAIWVCISSSSSTEGSDSTRPSTDGSHQAHKGSSRLSVEHFHQFRNPMFSGETTKEFDER